MVAITTIYNSVFSPGHRPSPKCRRTPPRRSRSCTRSGPSLSRTSRVVSTRRTLCTSAGERIMGVHDIVILFLRLVYFDKKESNGVKSIWQEGHYLRYTLAVYDSPALAVLLPIFWHA